MNKILITVFLMSSHFCFGQKINTENWTENEKAQYGTLIALAGYVYKKEKSEISRDSLFKKYIYFDYILNDTISKRKKERLKDFDTLFYYFRKIVNSIGLKNLEAKPVRFYKNHKIYEPFDKKAAKEKGGGGNMYLKDENVFAYYKRGKPEKPLGTLLFEPKTNKLVAWIMINQGGYRYFLTFNLL